MYTLHITNKNYSSWSLRPWVLMRECGIAFNEHLTPLNDDAGNVAFRSFSPTGKVPCLVDGDITVWDSLAITEYLAERHAGVWPRDQRPRAWARSAAAEMHAGFTALRGTCPMSCGMRIRLRQPPAALQTDLDRLGALWEQGLSLHGGPFLAGATFSAVDAFFAPVAFRIQSYELKLAAPLLAYAQRLRDLSSMRTWYISALAETLRDRNHDQEIMRGGQLIADLRAVA
jgi:glutathione S-transferase